MKSTLGPASTTVGWRGGPPAAYWGGVPGCSASRRRSKVTGKSPEPSDKNVCATALNRCHAVGCSRSLLRGYSRSLSRFAPRLRSQLGATWPRGSARLAHEGVKLRSGRGDVHFGLDTGFKLF